MAGNGPRRGAKRNPGSKKGQTVGSGGQRRRGLEGKGPTPKASERPSHPAHRRARAAAKRAGSGAQRTGNRAAARSRGEGGPEWVAGRNPVVEALRAGVPATALYVAARIDGDDTSDDVQRRNPSMSTVHVRRCTGCGGRGREPAPRMVPCGGHHCTRFRASGKGPGP